MKILLFVSNTSGGILQFTMTVMKTLERLGYSVKCLVPSNAEYHVEEYLKKDIIPYSSSGQHGRDQIFAKMVARNQKTKRIKKIVDGIQPDLIWFTDNPLATIRVGLGLVDEYKCLLTLHDANTGHPSRLSFYQKMLRWYSRKLGYQLETKVDKILLLSKNSETLLNEANPELKQKTIVMQLGAHIPAVAEVRPSELSEERFHLFFGRIDEYKGLDVLLKAYHALEDGHYKLVIAGNGLFSEEEKCLLNHKNIICLNRYISDGEMIWLIKHAVSTVLPYKQATQSGIIPIAYHFGVPVIVSDTAGLTQNVIDQSTGFICKRIDEYVWAIKITEDPEVRNRLSENAIHYADQFFDWEKNMKQMMEKL